MAHHAKTTERGYGAAWRKIRKSKLATNPLCEACSRRGVVSVAALVHHKDHDQFNNSIDNLESLCNDCHERHHAGERFGHVGAKMKPDVGLDGYPTSPGHPWSDNN